MGADFLTGSNLSSHDAQRVFRALLDASANPGKPTSIVITGRTSALPPVAFPALALADIEVSFAVHDAGTSGVGEWAAGTISQLTGARRTNEIATADLVVAITPLPADLLGEVRRGSVDQPEAGARVFVACERLLTRVTAPKDAVRVWVRGPGAADGRRFDAYGIEPAVFEAIHDANADGPSGIDVWLIDVAGSVVGLPRSSQIEILAGDR